MPPCIVCKYIKLLLKTALPAFVGCYIVGMTVHVAERLAENPTAVDRLPVLGCYAACFLYASAMLMFVEQALQALSRDYHRAFR
jgi:Na+/glutamate symporter